MTAARAIEKIYALPRFARGETLEPVRELLSVLHNPETVFPAIHVAGTNGKGSVSTMISSILVASGRRVGLYTSPYIHNFRERFQINNMPVSAAAFAAAAKRVFDAMKRTKFADSLSQFDVVTAIGFVIFADAGCDVAVLECGLGGRLDATNVISPPLLAVITNIGLDHTDILGNSITAIAGEKCGIVKTGTGALICAPQDYPEAVRVCESVTAERGVPFVPLTESKTVEKFTFGQLRFSYKGKSYTSALSALYQVRNAETAIEAAFALRKLGYDIGDEAIDRGLATAYIPARLETVSLYPHILVDGAHNADAVHALTDSVERLGGDFSRLFCILGMMKDKHPKAALSGFFASSLVRERLSGIATLSPEGARAMSGDELCGLLSSMTGAPIIQTASAEEAISRILPQMQGKDLLLCFGSLYILGDIKDAVRRRYTKRRR